MASSFSRSPGKDTLGANGCIDLFNILWTILSIAYQSLFKDDPKATLGVRIEDRFASL